MTKRVMRVTTPTPPLVTPRGVALSDSEKAEALADPLEAQFQPVADPSDPAVIETVDMVLRVYCYEPGSKPIPTNPAEVQDAIRGLKISKAPDPDGIPNRGSQASFPADDPSSGVAF
jgi:archaellum component FlaG (FlaF/FlaG flagellin family)